MTLECVPPPVPSTPQILTPDLSISQSSPVPSGEYQAPESPASPLNDPFQPYSVPHRCPSTHEPSIGTPTKGRKMEHEGIENAMVRRSQGGDAAPRSEGSEGPSHAKSWRKENSSWHSTRKGPKVGNSTRWVSWGLSEVQTLGEGCRDCRGHMEAYGLVRSGGFAHNEREPQSGLAPGPLLLWGKGHRRGVMTQAGPPTLHIIFPLLLGTPALASALGFTATCTCLNPWLG